MEIRSMADRLSVAASLLDTVAADRRDVPAGAAVDCLFAVEQLAGAGARLVAVDLVNADARTRLRLAMSELAALDDDTLSRPSILDAARAARHAYRQLG